MRRTEKGRERGTKKKGRAGDDGNDVAHNSQVRMRERPHVSFVRMPIY